MKFLLVAFLSFVLLGKSLFFLGWEVLYKIDQTRIAQEKCINKERPKMKCNGKCYLAKQLRKLEAEAEKNSSNKKINPFCGKIEIQTNEVNSLIVCLVPHFIDSKSKTIFQYKRNFSSKYLDDFFHPPC